MCLVRTRVYSLCVTPWLYVCLSVCLYRFVLLNTLTYKLHFWYVSSERLAQIRISRSLGQGQGHSSNHTHIHSWVVHTRLTANLVNIFIRPIESSNVSSMNMQMFSFISHTPCNFRLLQNRSIFVILSFSFFRIFCGPV